MNFELYYKMDILNSTILLLKKELAREYNKSKEGYNKYKQVAQLQYIST